MDGSNDSTREEASVANAINLIVSVVFAGSCIMLNHLFVEIYGGNT
jgi:hypothetical protein